MCEKELRVCRLVIDAGEECAVGVRCPTFAALDHKGPSGRSGTRQTPRGEEGRGDW